MTLRQTKPRLVNNYETKLLKLLKEVIFSLSFLYDSSRQKEPDPLSFVWLYLRQFPASRDAAMTAGVPDAGKLNPSYNLTDAVVRISAEIKFFSESVYESSCQA